MAHGHYVPPDEWRAVAHNSWRIADADIAATGADYVALGHWDRAAPAGDGRVPAFYSGSPDLAGTVNLIRLCHTKGVTVSRVALARQGQGSALAARACASADPPRPEAPRIKSGGQAPGNPFTRVQGPLPLAGSGQRAASYRNPNDPLTSPAYHGGVTARAILLAVALVLYGLHGAAAADEPSCEVAGADAERDWRLPTGLLGAIGHIESGRYDPATGRVAAWPFTINAAGEGHYFDTAADAIQAVQDLAMRGVRLIDVGCYQVDLYYHPDAFASLQQAFDPRANAEFAARFLSELHDRTGSWVAAIAWYHSAVPGEGEPYRNKVMADWQGGGLRIDPAIETTTIGRTIQPAFNERRPPPDPVVVMISAAALRIHVYTPAAFASAAPAPAAAGAQLRFSGSGRLPRVITPHG